MYQIEGDDKYYNIINDDNWRVFMDKNRIEHSTEIVSILERETDGSKKGGGFMYFSNGNGSGFLKHNGSVGREHHNNKLNNVHKFLLYDKTSYVVILYDLIIGTFLQTNSPDSKNMSYFYTNKYMDESMDKIVIKNGDTKKLIDNKVPDRDNYVNEEKKLEKQDEEKNDTYIKRFFKNDSFHIMNDLVRNKKYDLIKNYSDNWLKDAFLSLMVDGSSLPFSEENNITYSINIYKMFPEKNKTCDFILDNETCSELRLDFLIWTITAKLTYNEMDEEERVPCINALKMHANNPNNKYYKLCNLILLSLDILHNFNDFDHERHEFPFLEKHLLMIACRSREKQMKQNVRQDIKNINSLTTGLTYVGENYIESNENKINAQHKLLTKKRGRDVNIKRTNGVDDSILVFQQNNEKFLLLDPEKYIKILDLFDGIVRTNNDPTYTPEQNIINNYIFYKRTNSDTIFIEHADSDSDNLFLRYIRTTNFGNEYMLQRELNDVFYTLSRMDPINPDGTPTSNIQTNMYAKIHNVVKNVKIWRNFLNHDDLIVQFNYDGFLTYSQQQYMFEDKYVISDFSTIPLMVKRWIFGINNVLLLQKDYYYYLLIITPSDDNNNYASILKNNLINGIWTKQDKLSECIIKFNNNYNILNLHPLGLSINGSKDAMQAYCNSAIIYGNHEILSLVLNNCVFQECDFPYFVNGNEKKEILDIPLDAYVFNSPFKHYFVRKISQFVRGHYDEYTLCHQQYPNKYIIDPKIDNDCYNKAPRTIKLKTDNFLEMFYENLDKTEATQDVPDSVPVCRISSNYGTMREEMKSSLKYSMTLRQKFINKLDKFYNEEYEMNNDKIESDWLLSEKIYNQIYKIIYVTSVIRAKMTIVTENEMLNCQQFIEMNSWLSDKQNNLLSDKQNNLLSLDVLYTGERYLYTIYFELLYCNIIRLDQYISFNAILFNMDDEVNIKKMFQILMGKGKTSVITPLVVFYYIFLTNKRQIIMMMPKSLKNQSKKLFLQYSQMLNDVKFAECIEKHSVPTKLIGNPANKFGVSARRSILIMESSDMQTYLLNNIMTNEKENENEDFNLMNTVVIMDEVDRMMNPLNSELNFPIKTEKPPYLEEIASIYINCLVNENVKEIRFNTFNESEKFVDEMLLRVVPPKSMEINWEYFKSRIYKIELFSSKIEKTNIEIVFLFIKMRNLLISSFQMQHNKDYGFGHKISELPKNNLLSIPYIGKDEPDDGSEYSDVYCTFILTILAYRYTDLTEEQIYVLMNKLYVRYMLDHPSFVEKIFGHKKFTSTLSLLKHSAGKILETNTIPEKELNELKKYSYLKHDYILNICVPLITISINQYNSSFLDISNKYFCDTRTGFSGTTNVWFAEFNDMNGEFNGFYGNGDKIAEAEIQYAMKNNIMNEIPYENNILKQTQPDEPLMELISIISGQNDKKIKYDALIDTTALLKDVKNYIVARKIYNRINVDQNMDIKEAVVIQKQYRPVVYFDENDNELVYIDPKHKSNISKKIFIYYDEKHTRGTDVKSQPMYMKCLITVGNTDNMTNVVQGMYRARKLLRGHSVDFFLTEHLFTIIVDHATRARTNLIDALYEHLKQRDVDVYNNMETRHVIQTIKTNTRLTKQYNAVKKLINKAQFYKEDVYNPIIKTLNDLEEGENALYAKHIIGNICWNNDTSCVRLNELLLEREINSFDDKMKIKQEQKEKEQNEEIYLQKDREKNKKDFKRLVLTADALSKKKIKFGNYVNINKMHDSFVIDYVNTIENAIGEHVADKIILSSREIWLLSTIEELSKVYKIYITPYWLWIHSAANSAYKSFVDPAYHVFSDSVILKNKKMNTYLLTTIGEQTVIDIPIKEYKDFKFISKYEKATNAAEYILKLLTFSIVTDDDVLNMCETVIEHWCNMHFGESFEKILIQHVERIFESMILLYRTTQIQYYGLILFLFSDINLSFRQKIRILTDKKLSEYMMINGLAQEIKDTRIREFREIVERREEKLFQIQPSQFLPGSENKREEFHFVLQHKLSRLPDLSAIQSYEDQTYENLRKGMKQWKEEMREAEKREPKKRDAEKRGAERRGAEKRGAERRGAEKRGAERRGAEKRDTKKREAEIRGAEGRGAEGREAKRRKAEVEAKKRDAERRDAERRDAERRDAERRDAERRDAERRDAERRDAKRRDAERRDVKRREEQLRKKQMVQMKQEQSKQEQLKQEHLIQKRGAELAKQMQDEQYYNETQRNKNSEREGIRSQQIIENNKRQEIAQHNIDVIENEIKLYSLILDKLKQQFY